MKKLCAIPVFILLVQNCLGQNSWDLQQCIKYAVEHNLSLKQAALNNDLNRNNADQAKASVFPSVNLGAQHTYNFGKTIDRFTNTFANTQVLSQNFYISSNVVLWSGLSQYNNIRANDFNYLSGVENLKQQENDLALTVANAYINVIFTDELLRISENQKEISTKQLERTNRLVEAGAIAKSVEFDVKAQLANDELNVTVAANNYQLSLLNLRQLMNYDSVSGFRIVKPELTVSESQLSAEVQAVYETALKNQPGIRSGDYAILSADKTYASSKGRLSPTISFNASMGTGTSGLAKSITGYNTVSDTLGNIPGFGPLVYDRQDPVLTKTPFADQFSNNVNKSIGFTLTVPLFNGLQTYTSVKNAKVNLLNVKYSQDLRRQNLYKTIAQAYANAKAALNKYDASKVSLEAAQQSFKFTEQKFNAGSLNSFDFNVAKNRLFVAESNLLQAKYDYIFKLKVLDYYQGKPLSL
jgi:outer membrane protein